MSAVALDGMVTSINNSMVCRRHHSPKFIPESVLAEIVNQKAAEAVLLEHNRNSDIKLVTPVSDLAEFFSKKAFKVFAILVCNRHLELTEYFYQSKFENHMLPVEKKRSDESCEHYEITSCSSDGKHIVLVRETFRWDEPWLVDHFCEYWQWPFVTPIFLEQKFEYTFPKLIRLPFTQSGKKKGENSNSFYSYVKEKSVHVNHVPNGLDTSFDSRGNPRVAIKQLKRLGENFERMAIREARALELMRDLKSEHLIKAIAYYKKGNKHYFMFPWAEMGNLREFWKRETPKEEPQYIIWALTQLTGLSYAIEELHHRLTMDSGDNCRHGDLKPENILCFETKDGPKGCPRLVITDVGVAKVHNKATGLRTLTTNAPATIMYAAPELTTTDFTVPKSRRFDIWSMGCILLEFVIWLLYGANELSKFSSRLKEFYEITTSETHYRIQDLPKTAHVHHVVKEYISHIKRDWRCSNGTAIQRLVGLIEDRLLKVRLNPPQNKLAPPARITESPQKPQKTTTWQMEQHSTIDLPRDPVCRAYAPEMREVIEGILTDLRSEKISAIGVPPPGNYSTPIAPSYTQFSGTHESLLVPNNTRKNVGPLRLGCFFRHY